MKHEEVEENYFLFAEGLLDQATAAAVSEHLKHCESCKASYQESAEVLSGFDELASQQHTAPTSLVVHVMEGLELPKHPRRPLLFRMLSRPFFFGTSLALILLSLTVYFANAPRFTHNSEQPVYSGGGGGGGGGGGPSGSYSQAQFDDTLIRNSVGNLFALVEGTFGALAMVLCFVAALIFGVLYVRDRSRRWALIAFVCSISGGVLFFCARALVGLFFGADYQDYSN